MKRVDLISDSIKNLGGFEFQDFVYELLSRKLYPGLNPTSRSGDLGEDARTEPSTFLLNDGKWISVAVSKESGWGKIEKDCDRCKETERKIDLLIFVTAGNPQGKTIKGWKAKVQSSYEWDLEVRTIKFLAPFANNPCYEDIVDDYLHVPPKGGDFLTQIEKQFAKETERALRNISVSIPGLSDSIKREEVKRIEDQIELDNSVLLTGDSGTGKSGIGYFLAKESDKPVLFLDARRLGEVKNDTGLRNHFGLKGSLESAIGKMARSTGCRVIVDQMDNSAGFPISRLLIDMILDLLEQRGVEIIIISRQRESHEIRLLEKLTSKSDFVELNSNPLSSKDSKNILQTLGVSSPESELVEIGKNLLNLEVIGRIIQSSGKFEVGDLSSEIDLWETYINTIRDKEGDNGENIISEAIALSKKGLTQANRSFTLDYAKSFAQKRLVSWSIIVRDYGRVYRFYHEKLQDYLYAFDATERGLSQKQVIEEIGDSHKSRNIYILIREIYDRNNPSLIAEYLREAWNV